MNCCGKKTGLFINVHYLFFEIINYLILSPYLPKTYTCPFCDEILTAIFVFLSTWLLIIIILTFLSLSTVVLNSRD